MSSSDASSGAKFPRARKMMIVSQRRTVATLRSMNSSSDITLSEFTTENGPVDLGPG
jgi:hypothetical protein